MSKDDEQWIDEVLRKYRDECFAIRDRLYQTQIDVATERLPIINTEAKATIKAKLVEARIDEARKIYTNYIPAGTLIGKAVLKRIKQYKAEFQGLGEAGK